LLSKREDSLYVGTVMAAWARKYLGLVRGEVEESRDLVDNRVTVRTGKVGYHTEIHTRGHHLVADEPIAMGGADSGPTPYDYLTAALGACTAMTLRMYADRKGLPVDAITVRLRHDKIHAAECRECATKEGKIDQIEREIELQGELDASQRERILEIADRCPVHRTLHSEIHVTSRLKE
jgi:putative redox protein